MPETSNQNFKLVVPITGYAIRKDADGVEKYVLSGLASNTHIDLTGERMAESAIHAMVKSLETNKVTLNNEHGSDWDDDFGEITRLWATSEHELMMEAELDPDHYRTKTLIKALDKGRQLGLSIGGIVIDSAWEFVSELSRRIMTYKDISLFHVAITGTPAVADTWVTPITKSVKDWKETPMPQETPTKTEDTVKIPAEEVTTEVIETEVTPPKADVPQNTEVETPTKDAEVETLAESVETETDVQPVSAEGETPEATETDTTTKSETPEGETPAEVEETPNPESTPAEPEAPEQKDETPASDESAPDPAEDDTSEVAKSAVFGDCEKIALVTNSIEQLSWSLQDHIWIALRNDEDSAQEKISNVADALDDFKVVILKVATALTDDSNADSVKTAADAFKATAPDAVSKSLDDKDAQVEELTKSIETKEVELTTLKASLAEKATELTTATTALDVATKEIEKRDARKGIAFDKFTNDNVAPVTKTDEATNGAQRKFAEFITNGAATS